MTACRGQGKADAHRTLSGVIDWGDVQRNEPCVDLQLYWSFFPPLARSAFLDAYGAAAPAQLMKARVMAVFLSLALVLYGHTEGMAAVRDEALRALSFASRP